MIFPFPSPISPEFCVLNIPCVSQIRKNLPSFFKFGHKLHFADGTAGPKKHYSLLKWSEVTLK